MAAFCPSYAKFMSNGNGRPLDGYLTDNGYYRVYHENYSLVYFVNWIHFTTE